MENGKWKMENTGPRMVMTIWGFGSPGANGHLGLKLKMENL